MKKIEYKKTYKSIYLPPQNPVIVDVPQIRYAVICGEGDPNSSEFSKVVEALYAFSYAVKMSYKGQNVPEGYYDYTVFPLEGVWDLVDKSKGTLDKNNFAYKMMIRQPDFLTDALFGKFAEDVQNKKDNEKLAFLSFETIEEGLCCQMMHMGSYKNEPESFDKMEVFCKENGLRRIDKRHREIYLSDPRKTIEEKLKTVLRFKVAK